jgi:hypothetical protein
MAMQVRRIVTGHDENGKAIVVSDEQLTAVSRGVGAGISGCEMWSTNRTPIDNSPAADASQRAGFVKHYIQANYVGTGAGTTFRINELATPRYVHRVRALATCFLACYDRAAYAGRSLIRFDFGSRRRINWRSIMSKAPKPLRRRSFHPAQQ